MEQVLHQPLSYKQECEWCQHVHRVVHLAQHGEKSLLSHEALHDIELNSKLVSTRTPQRYSVGLPDQSPYSYTTCTQRFWDGIQNLFIIAYEFGKWKATTLTKGTNSLTNAMDSLIKSWDLGM